MNWARLFFSPNGRIGRRAFWIAEAAFFAILVASLFAEEAVPPFGEIEHPAVLGALAAMGWSHVAVFAKRLHDLGRGTIWVLTPAVAFALIVAAAYGASALPGVRTTGDVITIGVLAAGAMALSYLAFLAWLGFVPGQKAANRFGPPPD